MLDTRWNINTFSTSFPLPSSACNVDRILTQVGIIFFKPSHMNNMRVGECLIPFIEIFAWFGRVVCRERERSRFGFHLDCSLYIFLSFMGFFLLYSCLSFFCQGNFLFLYKSNYFHAENEPDNKWELFILVSIIHHPFML